MHTLNNHMESHNHRPNSHRSGRSWATTAAATTAAAALAITGTCVTTHQTPYGSFYKTAPMASSSNYNTVISNNDGHQQIAPVAVSETDRGTMHQQEQKQQRDQNPFPSSSSSSIYLTRRPFLLSGLVAMAYAQVTTVSPTTTTATIPPATTTTAAPLPSTTTTTATSSATTSATTATAKPTKTTTATDTTPTTTTTEAPTTTEQPTTTTTTTMAPSTTTNLLTTTTLQPTLSSTTATTTTAAPSTTSTAAPTDTTTTTVTTTSAVPTTTETSTTTTTTPPTPTPTNNDIIIKGPRTVVDLLPTNSLFPPPTTNPTDLTIVNLFASALFNDEAFFDTTITCDPTYMWTPTISHSLWCAGNNTIRLRTRKDGSKGMVRMNITEYTTATTTTTSSSDHSVGVESEEAFDHYHYYSPLTVTGDVSKLTTTTNATTHSAVPVAVSANDDDYQQVLSVLEVTFHIYGPFAANLTQRLVSIIGSSGARMKAVGIAVWADEDASDASSSSMVDVGNGTALTRTPTVACYNAATPDVEENNNNPSSSSSSPKQYTFCFPAKYNPNRHRGDNSIDPNVVWIALPITVILIVVTIGFLFFLRKYISVYARIQKRRQQRLKMMGVIGGSSSGASSHGGSSNSHHSGSGVFGYGSGLKGPLTICEFLAIMRRRHARWWRRRMAAFATLLPECCSCVATCCCPMMGGGGKDTSCCCCCECCTCCCSCCGDGYARNSGEDELGGIAGYGGGGDGAFNSDDYDTEDEDIGASDKAFLANLAASQQHAVLSFSGGSGIAALTTTNSNPINTSPNSKWSGGGSSVGTSTGPLRNNNNTSRRLAMGGSGSNLSYNNFADGGAVNSNNALASHNGSYVQKYSARRLSRTGAGLNDWN